MTGWVRRFIEVDHTRTNVGLKITLEGRAAGGNRREMASSNEDYWSS